MKIFLTGSTGFVGSHLLPKLTEQGHSVQTKLNYLFDDWHDLVIHLAAKTSISTEFDPDIFDTNISFTQDVFRSNARIIFASSCSAMHMTNPYAYTKKYGEYLASKHGDALCLRFFNIYGPNNNKGIVKYLMDKKSGDTISLRGPGLERDYIHVDDVVDFIVSMVNTPTATGIVEVGSGVGTRTIQLAKLFMELSGRRFEIEMSRAGINEPVSMVSKYPIPCMDLKTGLLKTINS